ncbi:MAG: beta-N-acetylhexosaminidase [Gammaproteobacteria bacterium]|nr:beta-N-acetylhexosaminidase [Gammaproteobacteria bacterium]
MSLGPVMLDLQSTALTVQDRELLGHPQAGGIILFSRNFESISQLTELTRNIHALRDPHLIIAVDHEGGRIQRFREGFTAIPAMAVLGQLAQRGMVPAQEAAENIGWLLAAELLACGLDISFAPVLDVAHGISGVIGDRALHRAPDIVAQLGGAIIRGMKHAGMAATGKHFPGHGGVKEDSHLAKPVDDRSLQDLLLADIIPFERLIRNGLAGIMPAHVVYSQVDDKPAGYSEIWLKQILRGQLGFQGVIFSDDLSMQAAACGATYSERADAALKAGCDMVLVCNNPAAAAEVLESLEGYNNPVARMRLVRMHGKAHYDFAELKKQRDWQHAQQLACQLNEQANLELNV